MQKEIQIREYDIIDDVAKLKDLSEVRRRYGRKSDWPKVLKALPNEKWFTRNYLYDVQRKVNGQNYVSRFRCLNWAQKSKAFIIKSDGVRFYLKKK